MNPFRSILCCLSLLLSPAIHAQLPDSDIWLFDLNQHGDTFSFTNPVNITNRPGYDNQPVFSPDGKRIYYASYRDDNQADIYFYDLASHSTTPFCHTAESEYSPAFTPDGKFLSVVRVEKDSAQRLWKFPLRGGDPEQVFKRYNRDSVAYYCWKDTSQVLLLLIGNPEKLILANTQKPAPYVFGINSVGRTMLIDDDQTNFIVSRTDSTWTICKLVYQTNGIGIQYQVKCLKKIEDFALYKNQYFICGKGSKLYSFAYNAPYKESEYEIQWNMESNLASMGLNNISRIAISKDGKKIALVNTK
jgi:dipeptidyl aminopeptidase/acylaminoacyl peptidase